MKSIVVGTDGSETATVAVREAAQLARATGARVNKGMRAPGASCSGASPTRSRTTLAAAC